LLAVYSQFLIWIIDLGGRSDIFLRNVMFFPNYAALEPSKLPSSRLEQWEAQIQIHPANLTSLISSFKVPTFPIEHFNVQKKIYSSYSSCVKEHTNAVQAFGIPGSGIAVKGEVFLSRGISPLRSFHPQLANRAVYLNDYALCLCSGSPSFHSQLHICRPKTRVCVTMVH
jgi:hypothetical protein